MSLRRRVRAGTAALGALALAVTGFAGAGIVALAPGSSAATDGAGSDKISISSLKESDYISNAVLEYTEGIYGSFNNMSGEQVSKLVGRGAKVEALTDEDENYNQKWRVTWNLGNQSNDDGKGTKAIPYGKWYFDDTSNPKVSFALSQDLDVINALPDGTDVTPVWYAADRSRYQAGQPDLASNALKGSKQKLWITKKGDLFDFRDPKDGARNTLTDLFYFGQYADANGTQAPDNWQQQAKACLAGGDTAPYPDVAGAASPCGDRVEWLNGSGKSFAAGYRDMTDKSTQFREGKDYTKSKALYDEFARQVGAVQVISTYNEKGAADTVYSIEFWTHRTPWAGNGSEPVHRTFVGAHYKSNWGSYLYETTQFKYVEVPEKDSDGDGLSDRFEQGIGTCAFLKDSSEYAASPYCQGVENPKDTDGDGVEDGVEVTSTTPKWTPTGFKIEGTDPTVAPQKPASPEDPKGTTAGEQITGTTKPYMTVELWDLTGSKLLASTVADDKGNYTLEVGKALARMDGKQTNIYGNNIKFANDEDLASRTPQYTTLTDLANEGDNIAVRVWSDGMDNLGTTATTRPQFTIPTGVLASVPDVTKTEVADATQLTDEEKQKIKDAVTDSGLPGQGGTVTVRDDGSAVVTDTNGNTFTIPSQDLIAEKSKTPDGAELTVPEKVVTGDSVTDATVKATKDGEPFPGGVVYAKLPGQDGLVKVTVGEDGAATLPAFTPTAEDNKVILYPENSTDSEPLDSETITLGAGEPVPGDGKSSVGEPTQPTVPVSDGTTGEGKTSFTVTLKDKNGNPVTGAADQITVTRTDDGTLNKPEIKDNGDGTYTVTVSSEKAGSSPLEVKAGETVIGQTPAVTFEPGEVVLAKSTAELTRDGAAKRQPGRDESDQVTVTMKDQFGNPTDKGVTADDLALTGTDPSADFETTPSKRDGATGVYDLTVTSGTAGEFKNIQTTLGGENVGDPLTMVFVEPPADPAQSTLTVDTAACDKAVADGKDTCPVTITLKDDKGGQIRDPKRVPALALTGTAEDGTTATFSDITYDDEAGTYTANMTATKAGTYTIAATSGGQPIATEATAPTATFVPGPVAKASNWQNLPGTDNPVAAGTTVKGVTVTLTDANDNKLEKGTVVYVTVPGVKEPVKATVGEDGVATLDEFTPTASTIGDGATTPGATITVVPANAEGTGPDTDATPVDTKQTIGVTAGTPSADNTTVTIADADNNKTVDEPVTVTVTLKDADGNLVTDPEQAKTVSVKAAGEDGNEITGSALTPVEGKPGVYTSTLSAEKPGDYTVTTTVGSDAVTDKPTATFAVGQPAQADIAGLDPVVVGEKSSAVTVTVKDKAGNPTPNTTVYVKIGDGAPVAATVGEDGTVTLDGLDGRPGPISMTAGDAQAGGVPVIVYPAKDATKAIGSDTLPAKASTPENVTATQQPSGDVVVTAKVPNAAPGQQVTVYVPGDDGPKPVGTGTVYPDGTVKITVDAADIGDASAVTLTSGSGPAESDRTDPVAVNPVKKFDPPTEVTAVTPTGGTTTTVAGTSTAPAGTEVTVHYTNADGTEGTATGLVHKDGTFQIAIPAQDADKTVSVSVGYGKAESDSADATVEAQTPTPTNVTAVTKTDRSTVVSGTAEAGSTVTVKVGDGTYTGTAAKDTGAFTISVADGIPAGTEIDVTAASEGKVDSEPAYPVTRLTQLGTPTVSALTSPDGTTTTVSGKATPGQKVTVTDKDGNEIGTATAGDDGSYSFTTDEPLANGTELTAVAGEGLTASEPGTGSANTRTEAPTAKAVTSEDGTTTTVSGTAEPGATVTVTDPDGAEQTVTANKETGDYSVDFTPALKNGDSVKVTAQNGTEVPSEPATATVGTRLPAPTDVTAVTDPDGTTTTVTGTSTAPKDTPVTVTYTGTDGKQHTVTDKVGKDGAIAVPLDPAAKDGTPVTVTVGSGDTASKPAEGTAQTKTTTPTVKSVVTDPAGTTDPKTTVSGTAEPGATVTVTVGEKKYTGTADEKGNFSVPVSPALTDGTTVTVTATENGKVASDPATGTAVTKTATPTVPDVVTDLDGKGTTVTGTAEPGSTVVVKDKDGKELGKATAGKDGTYSVTIEPALKDGDTVTVTATGKDKVASDPATGKADTTEKAPTDVATTTDPATGVTTVTGKTDAKPGTTVTITDKVGNVVGTGTVNEDGTFSITTDPAQPGGTELNVTVGDKPVTSDPAAVTVKYPAATDSVAIADSAAGTTKVDGKATGAADGTPVTVRNAKGEVIGTGEVKDGKFTVTAKPALANGAVITVTVGTPNTSAASDLLKVTVQAIPAKPGDVDATVNTDGTGVTVTGTTDAGNTVVVTEADGTQHRGTAGKDGHFAVQVPGAKAGDKLTVTVVRNGLVSEAVTVTAHPGKATQPAAAGAGSLARTGAAVGGLALLALASLALGAAVLRRREQA